MKSNYKLTCTIAAILGAAQGHPACAASPSPAPAIGGLQEVVVTAQRRKQNIEDVPITMQAVTGSQLDQMRIANLDDLLKLTPNVTVAENGPGQGQIYIRGLAAANAGGQSSATIASFPNVAVYLDDQSVQFPGRNLDIYVADMKRIEVLEGPQGTLFGGGAEAGAIRYITNKPVLDRTTGSAEASYGVTAHGDPNTAITGVLNLPIVSGRLAARVVVYNDRRGGYIDNVPSTFTRKSTDLGNFYAHIATSCSGGATPVNGGCPSGSSATAYAQPSGPAANNYAIARNASNPVTYNGGRLEVLDRIDDDWNVLITQSYQNMEADGDFTQYSLGSDGQQLGPWQNTVFVPAYDKDRFESTAWTVHGKVDDLSLIYTGSYLDRHIDNQDDYTNYARSAFGSYYQCTGGPAGDGFIGAGTKPVCYSPVSYWRDQARNTHLSHELRISTPSDWRLRGIAGAYYEDFRIYDNMNFNYKTIPSCTQGNLAAALAGGAPCLGNVSTLPNTTANAPGQRLDNTAFGEDTQRGYKQLAFFGTASYDILPKVLTVSVGTRFYHYTEYERGSEYYTSADCMNIPNGSCDVTTPDGININAEGLHKGYHGFRSSANLTWHVTPAIMVYYTFSQGFRPGGFNRGPGHVALLTSGMSSSWQLNKPVNYSPDTLINNELGWKGVFLDHRLLLNGSLYHMTWDNVQLGFFNPVDLGNTTFITNGPNYTINGAELQFMARLAAGLTVVGSGSYNHAYQTNSPCLVANNPALGDYGQCITEVKGSPFLNPFGAVGGVPAFSPKLQYNLRLRQDWAFGDYEAYVMAGVNYVGSMWNQPSTYKSGNGVLVPDTVLLRYYQPAYHTFFASAGLSRDNWHLELYGTNLGNSDASTFTSSAQFIKTEVPLRPRVIGVTLGYDF